MGGNGIVSGIVLGVDDSKDKKIPRAFKPIKESEWIPYFKER